MNVNFFIRPDRLQVYASLYLREGRIKIATGEKISALRNWSKKKQEFLSGEYMFREKNRSLRLLERRIKEVCFPGITKAELLEALDPERELDPTVEEVFQAHLKKRSKLLAKNTIRRQEASLRRLLEFRPGIKPGEITEELVAEFINFNLELGMLSLSINNHLKFLRLIVKESGRDASFVAYLKGDAEKTFLSPEELLLLEEYDPEPGEERVLESFLFACYTGLRYSDLKGFKKSLVSGAYIRLTQVKGEKVNMIPLSSKAQAILDKYESSLPSISNQKFNSRIKEIARKAGIVSPVIKVRYRGAERIEKKVEKWELVSAHIARHTFATISLLNRVPVEIISKILGHTDLSTTLIYAKMIDGKNLEEIRRAWDGESEYLRDIS